MGKSNNQLFIVESAASISSEPTGVSIVNQCGKVRFVGQGINFEVYDSDGSAYIRASTITQPPIPPPSQLSVEIESVTISPDSSSIEGRVSRPIRDLVIQSRDGREINIDASSGRFNITNIRPGIYSLFPRSNPSMKTQVVVAPTGSVDGPVLPVFTSNVQTIPFVDETEWLGPWNWSIAGHTYDLKADPNYEYEIVLFNPINDNWFPIGTLAKNSTHFLAIDSDFGAEIYTTTEYYIAYRVVIDGIGYRSNSTKFLMD